jgi:hypothetical protein
MNKFELYNSIKDAGYLISLIKQFLDNPDSSKVIDAFIFHFNSITDWGEVKEHIINNDDRKTATAILRGYKTIGNLSDAEKVIIKRLRGNEKFKSTIINFGRFRTFLDDVAEWLADSEDDCGGKYQGTTLLALFGGQSKVLSKFISRMEELKKPSLIIADVQCLIDLGVIDDGNKLQPLYDELSKINKIGSLSNWNITFGTKHAKQKALARQIYGSLIDK